MCSFVLLGGLELGADWLCGEFWEDLKLRWGRHCTSLLSQTGSRGSEAEDVRDFSGGRYWRYG